MKRILFVRRAYSFGGAERRLLDWLSQIDYSRNEVYVVSPVDVFSERIKSAGIPAKVVALSQVQADSIFGSGNPLRGKDDLAKGGFWEFFRPWLRLLRRLRPDQVVMMQGYFYSMPLACVLAAYLVSRGHVYMTEHSALLEGPPAKTTRLHWGVIPGTGLWWYRQVWPSVWPWRMRAGLSKRILAASQIVLDREVSYYGYPRKKMGIIPHGVDTLRFAPSPSMRRHWRERHNIPLSDVVIVCVARFSREKRIDRLLNAFLAMAPTYPNLRLLLAGDGPLRPEMEAAVRCVNGRDVSQRVCLLGQVQEVVPLLQASDIHVLPSDNEGFGIALIEAMAAGLVCVSTRTAGPSQIITDGENGFLVEISDRGIFDGLAKAIRMSPGERARMGARARETVVERYELRSAVTHALRMLDIEARTDVPESHSERHCQPALPRAWGD